MSQGGHDEEDGIGSSDHGFVNLDFVHDEVFPQEGDAGFGPDAGEVAEVALEILLVGEDGDGVGPAVVVALGHDHGVEVLKDDADAGGGFFDFGDHGEFVRAEVEGTEERPEIIALEGGEAEGFGTGAEVFHFETFGGDDFVEFVHGERKRAGGRRGEGS